MSLRARFAAFVAERHPFALRPACSALEQAIDGRELDERDGFVLDALREPLRRLLEQCLSEALVPNLPIDDPIPDTTPGTAINQRLNQAVLEVIDSCDGFLRREAIEASLTIDEKREILRGMLLTRATDNRLKQFFTSGEVRYGNASFQGKGFRSLGQEAIYAAAIRLRRGAEFRGADGSWRGDVISPMIRDLGAVLAMRPGRETVRMALSAQMGKAGPPMNGKDLHVGDWEWGILPAMAPLGAPALTISGIAMAFALRRERRVAVSFIGEGATSLGEWHEAINAAAARKLPAIFCVQNNQTALSTPVSEQSSVRVFAEKAAGYGIPSITIDGTDPEAIAAAFACAAERARSGRGPTLIELVAMRMCGHAHHDDMLYLGKDPQPSWSYPPLTETGYANRELYEYWCAKDPIATYAAKLEHDGVIKEGELDEWKREIETLVDEEARKVIEAPWPEGKLAREGVYAPVVKSDDGEADAPPFDPKGKTFLE